MLEQLKAAIETQTDGIVQGDTTLGEFSFVATGFQIAGNYSIIGDLIEVQISKKPWLLSCGKIESEIRKYMADPV